MLPRNHSIENRLLAALGSADFDRLRPSLDEVSLSLRQVIELPGQPIASVYFVETGVLSVFSTSPRRRLEVGMIGSEGMSGLAAILDDDRSANETIVQGAGSALRISTEELKRAMLSSPTFRSCLLHFAHVFVAQASQTALANGYAKLEERLARWIFRRPSRCHA